MNDDLRIEAAEALEKFLARAKDDVKANRERAESAARDLECAEKALALIRGAWEALGCSDRDAAESSIEQAVMRAREYAR